MFAALFAWIASAIGTTATTVATAASIVYTAAVVAYGVTSSRRQAKRQREAYENNLRDRTVTIRSADSPHVIIYGRALVGGTVVYALGPTEGQPYFYIVLVLAGHECDGLEAVYANGRHMPIDSDGSANSPGNYYRENERINQQWIVPDENDLIYLGEGARLEWAQESGVNPDTGDYVSRAVAFSALGGGVFQLTDRQFDGQLAISWFGPNRHSFVRVKFYRGTPDQQADPDLMAASAGAWRTEHRLRGRCYAIVRCDPDPDIFENGLPEFTFLVRGHRIETPEGFVWSNTPAYCTRHYLRTYAKWPASIIDDAACETAGDDCDEQVTRTPGFTHARYTCDGTLSTEVEHRENVASLLSSMVGTIAFDNGKAVMRAGVYRAPVLTLTDSDLKGPASVTGWAAVDQSFNAVKGRFFDGFEAADKDPLRFQKTWKFVPFPTYASPVYAAQDGGQRETTEIDLPMTLDTYRAQRIARLHLHRSRQALRHIGTWKLSAAAATPGKTIYAKLEQYGWHTLNGGLGKIMRVEEHKLDFERGHIELVLQEEAPAIYDGSYSELDGRDPAPNTGFPTFRELAPITGLAVQSGSSFVRIASDGTRAPFARVTWDQVQDASVLAAGRIELQHTAGANPAAQTVFLDPYQTAYDIPRVASGEVLNVAARARNGIAESPWATASSVVDTAAGAPNSISLVGVGINAVANASLRSALSPAKYFDKDSGVTVTTDGGSPGGGSADITIYRGGGATRTHDRPSPYGSIIWTESTVGAYTDRGFVFWDDPFPVVPGDVWELQCWLYLFRVFPFGPGLLYFDAAGNSVGTSWDDGHAYWASSLPADHLSYTGVDSLAQYYRQGAYCLIPANAVQARWAYRIFPAPGGDLFGWPSGSSSEARIAMPFAARSQSRTIEAAIAQAGPATFSNWNGS